MIAFLEATVRTATVQTHAVRAGSILVRNLTSEGSDSADVLDFGSDSADVLDFGSDRADVLAFGSDSADVLDFGSDSADVLATCSP